MTNEAIFAPEPQNSRALRDALGRFATGVTVVTIFTEDGPMGITANSFAAVSLDPALVLWSPARASSRFDRFSEARHFAIHVLHAGQADLCARFTRGGAGFEGLETGYTAEGVPLLPETLACFECSHHAIHDGGDHAIVVGRVERVTMRAGGPLLFAQGQFGRFAPGL